MEFVTEASYPKSQAKAGEEGKDEGLGKEESRRCWLELPVPIVVIIYKDTIY